MNKLVITWGQKSSIGFLLIHFVLFHTIAFASPKPDKAAAVSTIQNLPLKAAFEKLGCPDLSFNAFLLAWNGFQQMKATGKLSIDSILTVVDFSKPSTNDRLFIINLNQWKVVLQTLVAHGRNSGDVYAENFSNITSSYQSSLGVYVTGNTYQGKHGYSLQLNGMEKGINDKALERAIVVHGADYVSKQYIAQYGRIGRSFGCPAISYNISKTIIDLIKNGSCMFLYHPAYYQSKGLALQNINNELAFMGR